MLYIKFDTEKFEYEIEDVVKLFFREEEITVTDREPPAKHGGIFLQNSIIEGDNGPELLLGFKMGEVYKRVTIPLPDTIGDGSAYETQKVLKREVKRKVYRVLSDYTGKELPWGILTGIRPAKIVHELLEAGRGKEEILARLKDYFYVSGKKAELLFDTARTERSILDRTKPDMVSLYIGIPFCRTRCLYCSFTSNQIDRNRHLLKGYFEALKKEMYAAGRFIESSGLRLQTIYIGGGTPTSVDDGTLKELLASVEDLFDCGSVEEFTVEAGRPDSIDAEKLEIIRNSRASRISINPQTMNDETLRLIGRSHTSGDIVEAFDIARKAGFDNVNMDVIVGLPGEDLPMFERTMRELAQLAPESLTVHTMAVKRASRLNENRERYNLITEKAASDMIDLAGDYAAKMGMQPYYLYRQKNMLGNLENIGYCKPGSESIYNIQIMEERQTIIALGAGAITKVVYPEENRLERAFNVKSVEDYINRIDEMIERKRKLLELK